MSQENNNNYKLKLPVKAQWIQGKKSKILLDPFDVKMFLKENKGSKAFYRCSCNKTKHCPVRATLNMDTDMIERLDGFHNHDTDLVAENVKKIIDEKMDTVAANPTVSPRSVMTDITAKVLNDPVAATGVPSVPKYNTIAKMVQRKRKLELSCPKLPKEWKDMIIPDSMKTTCDNLPFVILDERIGNEDDDKVIWGFSSPSGMDTMRQANSVFADGTFEMVKQTLFSQIYVFVCPVGSISVPVAWFLLPNKEYTTYRKVLTCLVDRNILAPEQFHVDFEPAMHKAIRDVYPTSKIIGCTVHFKRAIKTNLQDKGLMQVYMTDIDVQTFIRYMWAVSLVPPSKIVEVWESFIIKNQLEAEETDEEAIRFNESLDSLLKYFEKVWIGPRGRNETRKKPLFNHSIWNHHESILADVEETTNKSEAWNSASKHCMVMKPCIWTVLGTLRKEESFARCKITAVNMGTWTDQHPGRTAMYNKKKDSLKTVVGKFGEVGLQEWMDMVISFYNDDLEN